MAVSGFNQLAGRIASGANNIAQVARVADRFTNSNTLRSIGRGAETVRNIGSAAQTFMDSGGNFGTATRMMGNAQQGVRFNAAPPSPGNPKQAIVSTSIDANYSNTDWRVSISVPSSIHEESEILEPLKLT